MEHEETKFERMDRMGAGRDGWEWKTVGRGIPQPAVCDGPPSSWAVTSRGGSDPPPFLGTVSAFLITHHLALGHPTSVYYGLGRIREAGSTHNH